MVSSTTLRIPKGDRLLRRKARLWLSIAVPKEEWLLRRREKIQNSPAVSSAVAEQGFAGSTLRFRVSVRVFSSLQMGGRLLTRAARKIGLVTAIDSGRGVLPIRAL